MDQELKAKWVNALRSGEHQQATGCMRDSLGYCCLGVLAYVIGDDDVFETVGDRAPDLIQRNDGTNGFHQHSFAEIADYIEKEIPCS